MTKETGRRSKRTQVDMELLNFHTPPSGEILVLGKHCPIGPQGAKRMLDAAAPGEFELVQPEDDLIDGILVKKNLFLRADKDSLVRAIVEEARAIMDDQSMITIKCDVSVRIKREIQG